MIDICLKGAVRDVGHHHDDDDDHRQRQRHHEPHHHVGSAFFGLIAWH